MEKIKPDHYKISINGVNCEVKDLIISLIGDEGYKHFCIGNAVKYLFRFNKKNGIEDIKKLMTYLDGYIEIEELTSDDI